MKKMNKINMINQELNNKAPDISEDIKEKVDWENIKLQNQKEPQKKTFNLKWVLSGVCCLLLICLSVCLPMFLKNDVSYSYNLVLEVNPSIKLTANEQNIVTSQKGLNEDAVILLYKENVVGQNIDDATKYLIGKMSEEGLIIDDIKISVKDSQGNLLNDKQDSIIKNIETFLNNDNIDILILSEEELDRIEDYYDNNHITEYEKSFVDKFRNKLLEIAHNKIKDIDRLINSLNIYNKKDETLIVNFDKQAEILTYAQKYNFLIDFNWNELTYKDIFELIEDLEDDKKELEESLKEINEESDDYNEILEELFELVKDDLFEME